MTLLLHKKRLTTSIVILLPIIFMMSCDSPEVLDARNGEIAFASSRSGKSHIYIMSNDGSTQRKVTDDVALQSSGEEYSRPSFSRDGKKIAFIVIPHSSGQFGIGKVNADGSDKRSLGSGVPDLQMVNQISTPTWASNEDVYFVAGDPSGLYYYSGNTGISRIDADWCFSMYGCNQYVSPSGYLTDNSGVILGTSSKIIYVHFNGEVTTLINGIGHNQYPSFSPDGNKIVSSNGRDVFIMNADGSNPIQLTSNAGLNDTPVWSPDGSMIAFSSNRDGNYEIYTMNADGTNQKNITNNAAIDICPSWASR